MRHALPLVLGLGVGDWCWSRATGIVFTGWALPIGGSLLVLVIGWFYTVLRPRPDIAETACYGGLWVLFTAFGAVQTYLGAASSRPLLDAAYVRLEDWAGFHWLAWTAFVRARPTLNLVLRLAYDSLMPQLLVSVFLFAALRCSGRNLELLANATVAICLTTVTAALMPALGPWAFYHTGARNNDDLAYIAPLLALRHGGPLSFPIAEMKGLDCFPSYHTVLAILFVYAHRGLRWSLPMIGAANAVMLVSIPSEGGHYLTDMLGGAAVALGSIGLVWMIRRAAQSAGQAVLAR